MKKKTKIILIAATLTIFSLIITEYQPKAQIPPKQPDICVIQSSKDNTPPPSVEHQISQTVPSQKNQINTQNQPADNPMEEQIVTPLDNSLPQPTEKEEPTNTPAPPAETPTKPTAPPDSQSTGPKMGDTRIVNGQKQSYFLGFGWVDDMGDNEVIYCEGMYENGNKIGIMGSGNAVDSDGDITKMVGIMD